MKGGLIGFIKHRKAVARWNFVKHEKIQYFESLNKVYSVLSDNEYSLYNDYSYTITSKDLKTSVGIRILLISLSIYLNLEEINEFGIFYCCR